MPDMTTIAAKGLQQFVSEKLVSLGVPPEDADICADVIVTADLFGIESHGVSRLEYYCRRIRDGIQHPVTDFRVVTESATTAVVDGNNGMGQVVAHKAMSAAIAKAREHGFGSVAVRNSSHFGIAGYYSLMCADVDLIGISFTNARPAVAPTNSSEAVLGTNPYAIAMPSDEPFSFLIDCATSVMQRGEFEVLARKTDNTYVGDSVVFSGEPTDYADPRDLLDKLQAGQAALLPIGAHKGYGLSVAIELFCSALQSGGFLKQLNGFYEGGDKQPYDIGHFFLAVNPASFLEIEVFKKNVGEVMRQLKESTAVGKQPVLVPGEKEYYTKQSRLAEGIPFDESLMNELKQLGFSTNP